MDLRTAIMDAYLPTPTTRDVKGRNQRDDATCLTGALLPTPRATRGGSTTELAYGLGGERSDDGRPQGHILLPTPCANPSGNTPEDHLRKKPGRDVVTDLSIIVDYGLLETGGKLMPTCRASDGEKGGPGQRGSKGDLAVPSAAMNFGAYAEAVAQQERVFGLPAPEPTEPGVRTDRRLSAKLPEWMMGLPNGFLTEVPGVTRAGAIKMAGNGVCPQQAAAALRMIVQATQTLHEPEEPPLTHPVQDELPLEYA